MNTTRRQLARAMAGGLSAMMLASADDAPAAKGIGVTQEVAEFIINARYQDIPAEVIELGKKCILDGLGLALSGSVAETGP